MKRVDKPIPGKVWLRGWQRDAAVTQAASAEVSRFIGWLQGRGFHESVVIIRQAAMPHGVRKTRADLEAALRVTFRKRGIPI
jgi:hypothetical protein